MKLRILSVLFLAMMTGCVQPPPVIVPPPPVIHSITLTWTEVTPAVTFTVYRSTQAAPFVTLKDGVTALFYQDKDVVSGKVYCYQITATQGNQTSDFSNEICLKAL